MKSLRKRKPFQHRRPRPADLPGAGAFIISHARALISCKRRHFYVLQPTPSGQCNFSATAAPLFRAPAPTSARQVGKRQFPPILSARYKPPPKQIPRRIPRAAQRKDNFINFFRLPLAILLTFFRFFPIIYRLSRLRWRSKSKQLNHQYAPLALAG